MPDKSLLDVRIRIWEFGNPLMVVWKLARDDILGSSIQQIFIEPLSCATLGWHVG